MNGSGLILRKSKLTCESKTFKKQRAIVKGKGGRKTEIQEEMISESSHLPNAFGFISQRPQQRQIPSSEVNVIICEIKED